MKKAIVVMAFAMLCFATANADILAQGPGQVTGSWSQQWIWDGSTVDTFTLTMISGSTWEHPIHDFSNDFTSTQFTPTKVSAAGTPGINFTFFTDFVTNMNEPLSFRWQGYSSGVNVDQGIATWDGSIWTTVAETATPEPGSLMLLGTGLLGIGTTLRKKFLA